MNNEVLLLALNSEEQRLLVHALEIVSNGYAKALASFSRENPELIKLLQKEGSGELAKRRKVHDDIVLLRAKLIEAKRIAEQNILPNQTN